MSILDTIVPIVGTVANAVAKGANFYKEIRGGGIEPEALAEVLKVEDKEKAAVEQSSTDSSSAAVLQRPKGAATTASASAAKTGQGFFYISPR